MESAVEAISVMPAVICREPEAMVVEMVTTCLTMPWMFSTNRLKCGGQLGDLVLAVDLQAGREVAFAFGDVPHALLDVLQGLDDGVAQEEGGREAQEDHDRARGRPSSPGSCAISLLIRFVFKATSRWYFLAASAPGTSMGAISTM